MKTLNGHLSSTIQVVTLNYFIPFPVYFINFIIWIFFPFEIIIFWRFICKYFPFLMPRWLNDNIEFRVILFLSYSLSKSQYARPRWRATHIWREDIFPPFRRLDIRKGTKHTSLKLKSHFLLMLSDTNKSW